MRGSRVLTRCSHMPVVHFGDNEFVGADAPTGLWGGAATPPYLAGRTPAVRDYDSSPSHFGFWAVESNFIVVLKSSNLPSFGGSGGVGEQRLIWGNFFRTVRARGFFLRSTQGCARLTSFPWAILFRAFSPFNQSLRASAFQVV